MSYIRSLSNPECLYIFGSRESLEIHVGYSTSLGEEYEGWSRYLPLDVWDEFCQGFVNEYWPDEYEHRGLSIKEEKVGDNFKMVLRYEDWALPMWTVTWAYIIDRYEPNVRYVFAKNWLHRLWLVIKESVRHPRTTTIIES